MAHDDHAHGHQCDGCGEHDHDHDDYEIEVVELEDENGEKEEFAILDEVEFEGRHFCIMAPLAEVQAQAEGDGELDSDELSLDIFEGEADQFTLLEDEAMAQRLMDHLDAQHAKLEAEERDAQA